MWFMKCNGTLNYPISVKDKVNSKRPMGSLVITTFWQTCEEMAMQNRLLVGNISGHPEMFLDEEK